MTIYHVSISQWQWRAIKIINIPIYIFAGLFMPNAELPYIPRCLITIKITEE